MNKEPNCRHIWLNEQINKLDRLIAAEKTIQEVNASDEDAGVRLEIFERLHKDHTLELASFGPEGHVDWVVEQKRLFNFDEQERKDSALAWVLLHQHPDILAEFCSKERGHDPRSMHVEIRVNGLLILVTKFNDVIHQLAIGCMNYHFNHMGLSSLEASAKLQAERLVKETCNGLYDKLAENMNALDIMRDGIDVVTQQMWNGASFNKLHGRGMFSVTLPPVPEYRFPPVEDSLRRQAITFFCSMIATQISMRSTRIQLDPSQKWKDELESLNLLARSIYADLDQEETDLANELFGFEVVHVQTQ